MLPVGASGHVAVDERLSQIAGRRPEFAYQVSCKAAFLGFDQCAGVMRDHPAQERFGALDVAEVSGAVERMEAGVVKIRRVPNVVQPRCGFNDFGIRAENQSQGLGLRGNALRVRPAAR